MWAMAWWTRCLWMVVVALWLPATMHCPLEAAGWVKSDCCSAEHGVPSCTSHAPESDGSDACPACLSVEDGALCRLPEVLLVKPAVGLPLFLIWEARAWRLSTARGEELKRGPEEDWRPPWWCRQRVAASPRAPAFRA